ncbi:MAG: carboxypeptidase regulatory-like domain-containing protein [Candidatus Hydrogenedentes bacterium]|nr:carboxypeptidase regulatory-like domain-containing protein [Candidatus Hydrogenedentota bacterium]
MTRVSAAILLCPFWAFAAALSGQVTAPGNQGVANARVWVEAGLGAALLETRTDATGSFSFDSLPAGLLGVFAYADGYAFNGASVNAGPADDIKDVRITMLAPGTVGGRVVDTRGKPVAGARITRVLLQGDATVGVPCAKLAQFGFEEPASDAEGRFTVPLLPTGAKVALKVGHPSYAQQSVGDLTVGETAARVQLYEGVLLRGSVRSRNGGAAVSNATIVISTAREPITTTLAKSDISGNFMVRLNPGAYLYQSASMELRSPGWEKLTVSGQEPTQEVVLRVAGTGTIRGDVRDAVTSSPIAGARVALSAFGSRAAIVTTGASGTFEFTAVEGENTVEVKPAAGYVKPERPYVTLSVKQGETAVLPTYWLRPLPAYRVVVVDADQKPVPGVIVRLIRPMQYRWYVTDDAGSVSLNVASVPASGKIVGMAEHPQRREGALFSLDAGTAKDAKVQLLALGAVSGTVVTAKDKPIEGAIVGGLFQSDADDEPLPLWRTTTGADGRFVWNNAVPLVPAACLANAGNDLFGRSIPFNIAPAATQDVGRIVIREPDDAKDKRVVKSKGLAGKKLEWYTGKTVSGTLPSPDELRVGRAAVVVYTAPGEAAMVIDALSSAHRTLRNSDLLCVAVVDGVYSGAAPDNVLVMQGKSPGPATTYVLDSTGRVAVETLGMPPASAFVPAG